MYFTLEHILYTEFNFCKLTYVIYEEKKHSKATHTYLYKQNLYFSQQTQTYTYYNNTYKSIFNLIKIFSKQQISFTKKNQQQLIVNVLFSLFLYNFQVYAIKFTIQ